jgi:hypothetical protein
LENKSSSATVTPAADFFLNWQHRSYFFHDAFVLVEFDPSGLGAKLEAGVRGPDAKGELRDLCGWIRRYFPESDAARRTESAE